MAQLGNQRKETQRSIHDILQNLAHIDDARELFSELNYDPAHDQLSRKDWGKAAKQALAHDPMIIAAHGEFQIIYNRLASPNLHLGQERPVINRLLSTQPYALFLFSSEDRSRWHLVNVKYWTPPPPEKLIVQQRVVEPYQTPKNALFCANS